MNLGRDFNPAQRNTAPWVFSTSITIDPKEMNDKDIVSCAIYQYFTELLAKQLFKTEKMLRDSLRGGLSVKLEELTLEHFDLEGRFDKVLCKLTLTNRGPARFVLETTFFFNNTLVTVATREGILYFEELN
jgi:hypothetical protein